MPDLRETLALPLDEEGPVFREPWEAQAFAMTINLYRAGHFTWTEWTEQLSQEIAAAKERGDPDTGETYYEYWLSALEKLILAKGLLLHEEVATREHELETRISDIHSHAQAHD